MIRQTSLMAFREIEFRGKLGERQIQVLKVIRDNPLVNDKEISQRLNLPINVVTPRRNELVKAGYVLGCGVRPCEITGRASHVWKINS